MCIEKIEHLICSITFYIIFISLRFLCPDFSAPNESSTTTISRLFNSEQSVESKTPDADTVDTVKRSKQKNKKKKK